MPNQIICYFAYGSNMSKEQMTNRGVSVHTTIRCDLSGYRFLYNKKSIDGSSKANIRKDEESVVHGVCFSVDPESFEKLRKFEKGYDIVQITVSDLEMNLIQAETFISDNISNEEPSEGYVDTIVKAAKEHKLPKGYIKNILSK